MNATSSETCKSIEPQGTEDDEFGSLWKRWRAIEVTPGKMEAPKPHQIKKTNGVTWCFSMSRRSERTQWVVRRIKEA